MTYGPVKATAGMAYRVRVFRKLPSVTLLPGTIFICEEITVVGPKIFATCRTLPHNVTFPLQISGQELMPAGYDPVKSALVLLALQAE